MFIYLLHEPIEDQELLTLKGENEVKYLLESEQMLELADDVMKYEVLDAVNPLKSHAFGVFNNIPVSDEGRGTFEERFQNRARKIEAEPGFVAIKVCRPLNSDTYIIMTFWESEADFENWKTSNAYQHAHKKRGTSEGIDQQQPQIFPRPSFVELYNVSN
ncbi:antibiotic biosynthesis monooxygenase [Anaerobacillus alkaliphilus]|uniref:Antibiotic biosynthesis monooxygenase n=1 Tax=Anaerobacillus alkaliphilus TaxID=1548597 RepID=A0A4Q0VNF0_9BACI|nr:antibiotic biosynthesis monooxygenase [Anaerobacillus alkaliphilus]RXI96516.1 antibiotic biosynthesis monooxygenase [Anaerobacillus alkaliphilus]